MQEQDFERYVIEQIGWVDKPQNRFIQIDRSGSGGYPNKVGIFEAEFFLTEDKAKEYKDIFARTATPETDSFGALKWEVRKVIIQVIK